MQQSQSEGALAGIRIIDLTRVLAGPSATQILGDHGADVIKVEPPLGDETRTWGPPFLDNTASYFLGINRNKRGITLDLASDGGRETLFQLLEDADILVENFKTGTLEKWGLGFAEVLQKRFPRLIYCRISGFGADGPLGGLPGYDAAVQAMTGLISVNGEGDRDPVRMGVPVVDLAAGLNAVIGILLALHERTRSGHGQFVESTLYDSGFALLHPQLPNFYLNGKTPVRLGSAHPNISPYDTFHTKTIPIFLAVGNDVQFRKLCGLLDCPDIADDARFKSNKDRNANRDALRAALEGRLLEHECEPLADVLLRAGVPCGPVLNLDQVVAHPHTKHRDMIVDVEGVRGTGAPVKLGRTPARYKRRPPKLGEHNEEVLGVLRSRKSRRAD